MIAQVIAQVSIPVVNVSFRKYSNLNFQVHTVGDDTKAECCLVEKKSILLIFSSVTISIIRRYVYAHVC